MGGGARVECGSAAGLWATRLLSGPGLQAGAAPLSWGPRRRGLPQPGAPVATSGSGPPRLRGHGDHEWLKEVTPLAAGGQCRPEPERGRVWEPLRGAAPGLLGDEGSPNPLLVRSGLCFEPQTCGKSAPPVAAGPRRGCWGPGGCPGAGACGVLPRWTVAMATPARDCGKHRLSKEALFPAGALQFQPTGAFQSWGGKGGQWGGAGLLVRKCHSGPRLPRPRHVSWRPQFPKLLLLGNEKKSVSTRNAFSLQATGCVCN